MGKDKVTLAQLRQQLIDDGATGLPDEATFAKKMSNSNNRELIRKQLLRRGFDEDYLTDSASFAQYFGFASPLKREQPTKPATANASWQTMQDASDLDEYGVLHRNGQSYSPSPEYAEMLDELKPQKEEEEIPYQEFTTEELKQSDNPVVRGMANRLESSSGMLSGVMPKTNFGSSPTYLDDLGGEHSTNLGATWANNEINRENNTIKAAKAEKQRRIDEIDNEIAEAEQELNRVLSELSNHPDQYAPTFPTVQYPGVHIAPQYTSAESKSLANERDVLSARLRALRETKRITEAAADVNDPDRWWIQNLGRGALDRLSDPNFYTDFATMGASALSDAFAMNRIADKINKGENLTDAERETAIAQSIYQEVSQTTDLPITYTSGDILAEMIPFVVQMWANPASGLTKGLIKGAISKFGKSGLTSFAMRSLARVGGGVAEGAVLANTLQLGNVMADAYDRSTGTFNIDLAKGKELALGEMSDQKGLGESFLKAEGSMIIENFTELLGLPGANKVGKLIKSGTSKALGKVAERLSYPALQSFVNRLTSKETKKLASDFFERTGWHGPIEEIGEEEIGIILNAAFVGDNQFSDLWDAKQQATIALSCGFFGGVMSTVQTGKFAYDVAIDAKIKRKMDTADAIARERLSNDIWSPLKDQFDNATATDRVQIFAGILASKDYNREQKDAIANYMTSRLRYEGRNQANYIYEAEENPRGAKVALKEAHDLGANINTVAGQYDAIVALQETERALRNAFQLDETDNIDSELQDAFGTNDPVEIAAQIEQYPKGVQDVVYDYLIAKAKHDGMMETFNDMVEASSNAIVDGIQSNAHSSGKLIKVQTTDGQECYVIEGNISSRNNVIDADNSDQTVIVRFPETAETKQIAVSSLNVDVYEETADANAFARQQADEYRQQAQAQFQENINGWGEALRQAEQAEAEQASQAKTANPQQQEEQSQGQEQRQPSAKTEAPATATNVPQQEQEQQQAQSQEQADPIFEEMDPQQATALIFEQLDQEDAVQFVENRRNLAHEQLEELQNNPPQIGIDFNKGRQAKAEWKQAVAKAADNVAFWDAVSGIINQQSAEQTTQEAQPIAQQENATEQAEQPSQAAQESVAENTTIAEPSATEQESVAPQIAEEQPTNEDITPEEDARREPLRQRAKVWEEKTGVKVVLIENEAEIEQESARREVAKSKVMGWYDRKSGKVYLYMPNLMSEEEIDQTFIHEVVIHKGLRGLLKEKAYNKVMRRVFRNMTPEQQRRWKRYPGVNGDIIKAADEFIAHSFETLEVENQSLWQKFIDAIRTALINMGLPLRGPLSMSDATLSSLIRRSYRKMANERAMDVPQEMVEIAEGIPSGPSAEPSFSIKIAPTLNEKSMEYAQHVGVSEEFLDILRKAEADINQMAERINSDLGGDLDAKRRGKRMLPEEVNVQDGKPLKGYSTIFKNGSYGRTMENTLKCLRTLAYIDFVNDVKEQIGRPLTAQESFLASQMLYDISVDPQCLYCYVSLDRKAYDEFLIRYLNQRDAVIKAYDLLSEQEKKDKKAIEALYQDFLASRKDTKEMRRRFNMWIEAKQAGQPLLSASDVATTTRRDDLRANGDASIKAQLKDAEAYAQGASWAKKEDEYRAYTGEILRMPQSTINTLNKEYGLRFYSFSEYSPAFIIENMQMIRDAAIRGLRGLAYTKEIDFAKIFAPTGININISVFGRRDANGNMIADTRQGADWAEAQSLRANYPNVGAVFVATNDADVEWALAQDWIDVVIPFHIVRTGADIANFYEWVNYSSEQADKDAKGRKADISPVEHLNSREQYMQLIEERNLTPRFAKWVDNPNYMKLVNETRRPYNQSPILSPVFNLNEAMSSWEEFNNKGGYYGGWYNVDEQGYQDAVTQVAEDIKEGRTAKDVDYGRQDVPADAWNTKRQTKAQRTHHNRPLTNASQAEQTESSADDDIAFSTSTEIDELYPNWLEGTTTDSGKHSTQVEGTRKTYGKVGTWIEENLGKNVAILDASSGMGYGTADLRERGFNIEDVEPYQSEERKQNNPATYSSYADIRKQYDYIISNAVLNVIPDDWRSNVLHDMANRLKTRGRMFINTRKAGEEKSIKDKIELDSPQEVLVKRNGRIASYQRFFTPQELKSWVEEELGEGYSVEIANEKNSGTKGLAAVVVTKTKLEDNQGNPIDENGKLIVEQVSSINEITDADFERPTRSIQLPAIPKNVDAAIGANGKPVIIKKNVFEKNKRAHKDLRPVDGRMILTDVLYNTSLYGQNQKASRPYNWILIHLAEKNSAIIIEINESKDNLEIINWHYLSDETLERKKRQAIREGGLILALDSAVANTPNDLSPRKDSNSASNMQENSEDIAFSIIGEQGTTVTRRKADIAVKLQGRDVSPTQLKVLDAFTTDANNITIDVVDANGEQRSITLKQGQDNRAGVKHSVLRHYETAKNSYTAEDILLIPQVVEQGERKQDGKKVSYKLDIGGVKYTVTTDIKGNHEEFTNFFTNRKPIVEEQGSSNTANQHEQPQQSVSANEGSDNISPLQENGELFKRGDIAFSIAEEEQAIIDRAKADGTYLKAPNGKPTKLTPKQWVQVRTQAFKNWFGDWENDPENSSKVVDENGEPMVVYHGTNAEFDIFDASHNHKAYKGFFFTDSETMGSSYGKRIMPSFLNIKDAFVIDGHGRNWNDLPVDLTQMLPGLKEKIKLHQSHFKQLVEKGKMPQESYDYWDKHYYQKVAFIEDASKNSFFDIIRKFIYAYQIKKFDASDVIGLTTREIERLLQDYDENANIIFRNITDYGPRPVYWDGAHDVFVVTNPNDIRPANSVDVNEDDIAFSIIGEKGASALDRADEVTHRMDNLNIAREMETTGKDAKAIRLATGWERGADGKWRYEIEDIEEIILPDLLKEFSRYVELTTKQDKLRREGKDLTKEEREELNNYPVYWGGVNFKEVKITNFTYTDLFDAYPRIADILIEFPTDLPDDISGWYDPTTNKIAINPNLPVEEMKKVFIHEIQHAIQFIEGFATGGHYANLTERLAEQLDAVNAEIDKLRAEGKHEEADAIAKKHKGLIKAVTQNSGNNVDNYRKLAGEAEARNAEKRMGYTPEQRRETLLADTEGVAREDQIFPDNPSDVAQQIAEALGVDIEIDETLPAKGSYNTRTGRIRINPHRHSSPQDIERTILHEVIGHGGLQALTGKHFPKLCQLAYKMMTEAQRADLRSRHGNLSNEELGAEFMAELAEQGIPSAKDVPVWRRIVGNLRNILRKLGFTISLSEADIRYMLYSAGRLAENGKLQDAINKATKLRRLAKASQQSHDAIEDVLSPELHRPIEFDSSAENLTIGELGLTDIQVLDAEALEAKRRNLKLARENKHSFGDKFSTTLVDQTLPIAKFIQKIFGFSDIQDAYKWNQDNNPWVLANLASTKAQRRCNKFRDVTMKRLLATVDACVGMLMTQRPNLSSKDAHALFRLYATARTAIERQERKVASAKAKEALDQQRVLAGEISADKAFKYDPNTDYAGISAALKWIGMTLQSWDGHPLSPINWNHEADNLNLVDHEDMTIEQIEKILAREGYPTLAEFVDNIEETIGADANSFWEQTQQISNDMLRNQFEAGLLSLKSYQRLRYGMTFEEIAKQQGFTDVKTLARAKVADTIEELVDLGILTEAEATQYVPYYEHYLPLKGYVDFMQSDAATYGESTKTNSKGRPQAVQSVKGHVHMTTDPIARLCYDVTVAIHNEEDNRWKQTMLNIVRQHEKSTNNPSAVILNSSKNGKSIKAFEEVRVERSAMDEHEVIVYENGQPRVLRFADKSVAEAMSPAPVDMGAVMKAINWGNRFIASAYTTRNPAFVIPNIVRDFQAGMQYNFIVGGWKYMWKYVGKVFNESSRRELYRALLFREKDSRYSQWAQEFLDNGGETAYIQVASLDSMAEDIKRTLNSIDEGKTPYNTAKKVGRAMLQNVDRTFGMAELVSRFATFIAARESGKSVTEATLMAKEVSVNFDRKGKASWRKWYPLVSIFQNAAFQALRREKYLYRESAGRYIVYRAVTAFGKFLVSFFTGYMFYCLWWGDDDDEKSFAEYSSLYFSANDHVQSANMIVPITPTFSFSLPVSLDDIAFHKMFYIAFKRIALQSTTGKAYNAEESPMDDLLSIASQFADMAGSNPITVGFGTLAPEFDGLNVGEKIGFATTSNPIIAPWVQSGLNRDYKGDLLHGEPYSEEDKDANHSYDFNKSSVGHNLAKFLSNATGGEDDYRGGWINFYGETIDLFLSSYFGGYADMPYKTYKTIKNSITYFSGEPTEIYGEVRPLELTDMMSDIPVGSRFLKAGLETYQELDIKDHNRVLATKAKEWEGNIVKAYKNKNYEDAKEQFLDAPLSAMPDYFLSLARSETYALAKKYPVAKAYYNTIDDATYHTTEYDTSAQANIIIGQALLWKECAGENLKKMNFEISSSAVMYKIIAEKFVPMRNKLLKADAIIAESSLSTLRSIDETIVNLYNNADIKEFELPKIIDRYQQLMPNEYED